MKNTKLLVLAAFAALSLSACGGNGGQKSGELPSGGTNVDVSTETGTSELKARLNNVSEAYSKAAFTSFGIKNEFKNGNADVSFNYASMISGKLSAKNFASTVEFNMDAANASLAIKDVKGALDLDASLKMDEEADPVALKHSLSVEGFNAAAYATDKKVYVDLSSAANRTVIQGFESFANGIFTDLGLPASMIAPMIQSMAGIDVSALVGENGFAINDAIDELVPERKFYVEAGVDINVGLINEAMAKAVPAEGLDEFVTEFVTLSKETGAFKFLTYAGKGFGLQANITKESLKALVKATAKEGEEQVDIDSYVKNLDIVASIYFDENALLSKIGFAVDAGIKYSDSETGISVEANLKAEDETTISYNSVSVNLPAATELAKFPALQLPQSEPVEE